MWIVLRLVLAVIGFGIRQLRRRSPPKPDGEHAGAPYYLELHKDKQQKTTGFSIGMPLRAPTWIRMHVESGFDRFFKRLGLANESETGDAGFDARIYVTCDHGFVATLLRDSPALRAAILRGFELGFRRIRYDGVAIWLDRCSRPPLSPAHLDALAALHAASAPLAAEVPSRFADRFLWKALVVEGLTWSLLGFAIGAAIEQVAHREDYHVRPSHVVIAGLAAAMVGLIVVVAIIALWLRGSSRGHRLIVESGFVLLLGLPVTGIQVVGDTNRALDDAPSTVVVRHADHCETREHRSRRGRRTYTYHLWLLPTPEQVGPALPRSIEVTRALCGATSPGTAVELSIGPGRWGLPWYRRIRVGELAWNAPS